MYLRRLLGKGRRKSVEPLAGRVAPGQTQQIHHFVSTSNWAPEPQERLLVQKANGLVGGEDALLIVDDTALVKEGRHSAGVGHQYCGELGKKANCQALVSLTQGRLVWAVGVLSNLQVYPDDVQVCAPRDTHRGRPPKHPVASPARTTAQAMVGALPPTCLAQAELAARMEGAANGAFGDSVRAAGRRPQDRHEPSPAG